MPFIANFIYSILNFYLLLINLFLLPILFAKSFNSDIFIILSAVLLLNYCLFSYVSYFTCCFYCSCLTCYSFYLCLLYYLQINYFYCYFINSYKWGLTLRMLFIYYLSFDIHCNYKKFNSLYSFFFICLLKLYFNFFFW